MNTVIRLIMGALLFTLIISGGALMAQDEEAEQNTVYYYYSEITPQFTPGPFTVEELASAFGDPISLKGQLYSGNGDFCIIAEFKGISFTVLAAPDGPDFSFATDKNMNSGAESFQVTEADRKVMVKPYITRVNSPEWTVVRWLKVGDSLAKVEAAYDGHKGVRQNDGQTLYVYYSYCPDSAKLMKDATPSDLEELAGGVDFEINNDKVSAISIRWYNGYLAFD